LAGSCIGIASKEDLVTGHKIENGDAVVGIPSSGVHSNGLTLARKLLAKYSLLRASRKHAAHRLAKSCSCQRGSTQRSSTLIRNCEVHGLAHITGGGLLNLKRLTRLGFNLSDPLEPQEIFSVIQAEGVDVREMYKTFNMGMGFAIVAPQREARRIAHLSDGAKQVGTISGRGIRVRHDDELVEIAQ